MPTCYCPMGRRHFADAGPDLDDWMPTFEHIVPKRDGGRETVDNGILAHRLCNRLDYAISDGRPHERDLARIRRARDELERKSPRATRADSR